MQNEHKNYEIAFLINSNVAEEEISSWMAAFNEILESAGALIHHSETPKKVRLAYAVNKERNAYLGWTRFAILPDSFKTLEKKLRGRDHLLRYLIVREEEVKASRPPRPLTPRDGTRGPKLQKTTKPAQEAESPEEKLDLEELDKKLDEILGK